MSEEGVSDIDKRAAEVGEELLPPKSRKLYEQQYDAFKKWCRLKNVGQPTENALLVYFNDKSKAVCASTLWAHYSMLKSVINIREDIDISKFPKLLAFLKRRNERFKPKKSRILTSEQVDQFLREAPDDKYLMLKVNLEICLYSEILRNQFFCRLHLFWALRELVVEKSWLI